MFLLLCCLNGSVYHSDNQNIHITVHIHRPRDLHTTDMCKKTPYDPLTEDGLFKIQIN